MYIYTNIYVYAYICVYISIYECKYVYTYQKPPPWVCKIKNLIFVPIFNLTGSLIYIRVERKKQSNSSHYSTFPTSGGLDEALLVAAHWTTASRVAVACRTEQSRTVSGLVDSTNRVPCGVGPCLGCRGNSGRRWKPAVFLFLAFVSLSGSGSPLWKSPGSLRDELPRSGLCRCRSGLL